MSESQQAPSCEFCGAPARLTDLGSLLCERHSTDSKEYLCKRCGVRAFSADTRPDFDEVCDCCLLLERFSQLPGADREAVLTALKSSKMEAVMEGRNRLDWGLKDLKSLVYLLDD